MKIPKPIIKFNGGCPVALCNRCFIIMCYVSCADKDLDRDGNCVVIEHNGDAERMYTKSPIGEAPPLYCDRCKELLTYTLNE